MHLTPRLHRMVSLLFLLYLAVLLRFILFKSFSDVMFINISLHNILYRIQHLANFTLFKTIRYYMSGQVNTSIAVQNILGNILLFSPLGFFVPLLRPRLSKLVQIAVLAFGISLLLELVQLLTGLGGFDVDDLLLNVLGGLLGWLAFRVLRGLVRVPRRG